MSNPNNPAQGNSAFTPGMAGNGVIVNNTGNGAQSLTNGTLFDSNAAFGTNAPNDFTARFANPGPMANGPGSGLSLEIRQQQTIHPHEEFWKHDLTVVDGVSVANVNGELAQHGFGNLGGVGIGQMPNAGGGGAAAWTQAGGLSLGFELPMTGQKLVFSKAGGDPKLALGLRPQESLRWGLSLVWTLVWLTVGLGVAIAMCSGAALAGLARRAPLIVAVLSLLGFVFLPSPLNALSFLAFVGASVVVAWTHRNAGASGL